MKGCCSSLNGATGSLAGGWVDVVNPVTLELSGTRGYACVFNRQLFFKSELVPGADGKEPWTELAEPWPHAFELFLDAVVGKEGVPLVGAREAAYRSAVMEALYRAAREQIWASPVRYDLNIGVVLDGEAAQNNPNNFIERVSAW